MDGAGGDGYVRTSVVGFGWVDSVGVFVCVMATPCDAGSNQPAPGRRFQPPIITITTMSSGGGGDGGIGGEAPTEMYDAANAFEAPAMAEEEEVTGEEKMEADVFGSGNGQGQQAAGGGGGAGGRGGLGWGGRRG